MKKKNGTSLRAALLIVLAGTLWGSMGVFVRTFSSYGFSAMQIASMRLTVSALLFTVLMLCRARSFSG